MSREQSEARAELRREKACVSDAKPRAHAGGVLRQLQGGVRGAGEQLGSEGGRVAAGAGALCTEKIGKEGVQSVYGEEDALLPSHTACPGQGKTREESGRGLRKSHRVAPQ